MVFRQVLRCLAIGLAVLLPLAASAQESATIVGRIVEQGSGRPISQVVVLVVGTNVGARTNDEGVYRLVNAPVGSVQLRAARIGFAAQARTVNILAGLNENVDFSLSQATTVLDAVVTNAVTGQVERRREVGANVGNITVTDIAPGVITKMSDVLTGRTAGVTLQGTAGSAGTGQRIRIRGANSLSLSNEPLIYVDGVQVSNSNAISVGTGGQGVSRLNDIAAEDIESIEVLKGPAATAVYGTAAANGVLLISTKRGRSGTPRWSAYGERGSQEDVIDYPSNFAAYDLITPGAPLTTSTGAFNAAARKVCFNYVRATGGCTYDSVAVFNTLLDERTRPFVKGDNTKLGTNVAGGSDQTQYYVGVDHQSDHGVIEYNTLNKTGLRVNLNTSLNRKLDFSVSSQYTRSKLALNSNDNSIFSPLINGLVGSAFYYPDTPTGISTRNYRAFNQAQLAEYVAHQDVDRFTIGTIGNMRPLSWLTGNVNVGLDYINRHDFLTLQPNRLPIAQTFTIGNRSSTHGNQYLYTGTGSLGARFDLLADLASTTTLGASYNRSLFESTVGFGAGIVEGTANLGATSSFFSVDEGFSEVISVGAFARQELAWRDRLFLAASLRVDDNSAFGTDFGTIYYPGVNASWVVAEEPWFPTTDYVSSLRVRAAYGRSGQRPDFRDAVTFFEPVAVLIGASQQSAVTLARTGNLDLKPEKTDEYEFGADLGLLRERVSLQFTYFDKRSRDALISRRLAPSFGLTATNLQNLGGISNKGTEAQLDVKALDRSNVQLNVRLTATQLRNRIVELGTVAGKPVNDIILNRGIQRHKPGYSAGAFFQRPYTYNDANRDGLLSKNEVFLGDTAVFIGDAIPRWNRSVSADLELFNFLRISTLFEGRGGNKQGNFGEYFRCVSAGGFTDRGCSAVSNPNATLEEQARFVAAALGGGAPSVPGTTQTGYIENGGFVKWREFSVALEVPARYTSYLQAASIRGASISFAGRNLATWTSYTGLDPEIIEAGTSSFNQSEFNTQPSPRIYTLRLNLNF